MALESLEDKGASQRSVMSITGTDGRSPKKEALGKPSLGDHTTATARGSTAFADRKATKLRVVSGRVPLARLAGLPVKRQIALSLIEIVVVHRFIVDHAANLVGRCVV